MANSFTRLFTRNTADAQERSLYARATGNLQVAGQEGLIYIGSDTLSGILNNSADAEALPLVTRATSLITGPLTAAPFRVQNAGAGAALQTPRWLTDPMMLRPDARLLDGVQAHPALHRLSRSEFWTNFVRSAIWWGEGFMVYNEDSDSQPLAGTLRLLNPLLVSSEGGSWVLGTGPDSVTFNRDGYTTIGGLTYRIVCLRNPHSPVDEAGRSKGVFALSPGAFGLASQVDSYAAGTFSSGVPAGVLKVNAPNVTQEQVTALGNAWKQAHGGDKRSIAVLTASTDFQPISLSPVQAELAAVKRLAVADCAFAFGLDPMNFGAGLNNSGTYSNLRDAWENHNDFGLSPWISALQDLLSSLMPGNKTVSVDLDKFQNESASTRYASYKVAIDAGFMTIDEARALEGLPPLPTEIPPVELPEEPEPTDEPGETEEAA